MIFPITFSYEKDEAFQIYKRLGSPHCIQRDSHLFEDHQASWSGKANRALPFGRSHIFYSSLEGVLRRRRSRGLMLLDIGKAQHSCTYHIECASICSRSSALPKATLQTNCTVAGQCIAKQRFIAVYHPLSRTWTADSIDV